MTYWNRKPLLEWTLKTIEKTSHKDFEIIIVDDFSDPDHDLSQIKTDLPVKVIKLQEIFEEKTWNNGCIAYNVGFSKTSGDKIIIQNAECSWQGDVLTEVETYLNDSNYLIVPTRFTVPEELPEIQSGAFIDVNRKVKYGNYGQPVGWHGWYNHKTHRPKGFHFCNAITRKNLQKLNGFDERYANGWGYDDNEFRDRVNMLNLNWHWSENCVVFHQWHTPAKLLGNGNKLLYENTSLNIRVNGHKNVI